MNYGVPYKGNKSRIAEKLIDSMPAADAFVDLFAGGCSMAHRAMLSGKYKRFVINDINPMPTQLFVDAIHGKYRDEKRWISREDFFRLKDTDAYVRYCWSFGNNGRDYLYSKEKEPFKKLLYEMLFADTAHERRLLWRRLLKEIEPGLLASKNGYELQNLESLERLQSLERLERLERLQSLERLERHALDYEEVPIPEGSVIYCDIPYKGTDGYEKDSKKNKFDYGRFYDWVRRQACPVFISEYDMPSDRFECVLEIKSTQRLGKAKDNRAIEKLFKPIRV